MLLEAPAIQQTKMDAQNFINSLSHFRLNASKPQYRQPPSPEVSSAADAMLQLSTSLPVYVNGAASAEGSEIKQEPAAAAYGGSVYSSDGNHSDSGGDQQQRRDRAFVPEPKKDDHYWQKRRKNNEAAKKSREKRRQQDKLLAEQNSVLRQESDELKRELEQIKAHYGYPPNVKFSPSIAAVVSGHVAKPILVQPQQLSPVNTPTSPPTVDIPPPPSTVVSPPVTSVPTSASPQNALAARLLLQSQGERMNPTAAHVNTASPFVEHGSRNDVASGERKRRYSSEMAIDYTTTHYNKLSRTQSEAAPVTRYDDVIDIRPEQYDIVAQTNAARALDYDSGCAASVVHESLETDQPALSIDLTAEDDDVSDLRNAPTVCADETMESKYCTQGNGIPHKLRHKLRSLLSSRDANEPSLETAPSVVSGGHDSPFRDQTPPVCAPSQSMHAQAASEHCHSALLTDSDCSLAESAAESQHNSVTSPGSEQQQEPRRRQINRRASKRYRDAKRSLLQQQNDKAQSLENENNKLKVEMRNLSHEVQSLKQLIIESTAAARR